MIFLEIEIVKFLIQFEVLDFFNQFILSIL